MQLLGAPFCLISGCCRLRKPRVELVKSKSLNLNKCAWAWAWHSQHVENGAGWPEQESPWLPNPNNTAVSLQAHNDLLRTYEAKLLAFGVPLDNVGFKPLETAVIGQTLGQGPAGLVGTPT